MKVVVVDDHDVVRAGLTSALAKKSIDVVAQARGVTEAMAQIAHSNPDAVIIDLSLKDGNGLEVVEWVRTISSTIGIVVLTMNGGDDYLLAAMRAGANAFIDKSAPMDDVLAALTLSVTSPQHFTAAGLRGALERQKERFHLSARELEVLSHLPHGQTAAQIGKKMFLAEATIKSHLAAIYRKLDVPNRMAAITKARKAGLLKE